MAAADRRTPQLRQCSAPYLALGSLEPRLCAFTTIITSELYIDFRVCRAKNVAACLLRATVDANLAKYRDLIVFFYHFTKRPFAIYGGPCRAGSRGRPHGRLQLASFFFASNYFWENKEEINHESVHILTGPETYSRKRPLHHCRC